MIQRIQSIFYLLAAICFGSLFRFPFATSEDPIPQYLGDNVYNIMDHIVLTILASLGIMVSLIAIFIYRKRDVQIRMGYVIIIVSILIPLVAFLLMYNENTAFNNTSQINDGAGIYIPVLTMVFAIFANRYVKKDDKIVKSMDRLR